MSRAILSIALCLLAAGCHVPMPQFQPFAGSGSPRVPAPATGSYGRPDSYYTGTSPGHAVTTPGAQQTGQAQLVQNSGASRNSTLAAAAGSLATTATAIGAPSSAMPAGSSTTPVGTGVAHAGAASATAATATGGQPGFRPPASNYAVTHAAATSPPAARPTAQQAVMVSPHRAGSVASSTLPLHGMPVNDATHADEPQPFVPTGQLVEISQLPRTVPAVSSPPATGGMRGFVPPTLPPTAIPPSALPGPATGSAVVIQPSATVRSNAVSGSTAAGTGSVATSQAMQLPADGWKSKYVPLGAGASR